jgi:predicted metallopeptidase
MDFEKVFGIVDKQLEMLSLTEKVKLLNEVLNIPVTVDNGKFYHMDREYDENRMKDFIAITQHWFTLKEYEKLKEYFSDYSI